jgi:predicted transcriptional regulator YdeE
MKKLIYEGVEYLYKVSYNSDEYGSYVKTIVFSSTETEKTLKWFKSHEVPKHLFTIQGIDISSPYYTKNEAREIFNKHLDLYEKTTPTTDRYKNRVLEIEKGEIL